MEEKRVAGLVRLTCLAPRPGCRSRYYGRGGGGADGRTDGDNAREGEERVVAA